MKKVIVKIIILILCITCIIGFWMFKKHQTNLINTSESIELSDLNSIDEDTPELENPDEYIIPIENEENIIEENTVIDEVKVEENTPIEQSKTEITTTTKSNSSNKSSTSNSSTSSNTTTVTKPTTSTNKTSTSNTEKSTTNNSLTNNNKIEPPKTTTTTPTQTTIPTTKSDKCYEGGSKHVAGTGPYEHGYYNTYKEAWNALTVFMEDMISGNYYIDECACGKFFFYVKED